MAAQIPKVLLVNDHYPTLLGLQTLLGIAAKEQGYEVITASSGQEALREVLKCQFAVILLDISMPGLDGFETAQLIHSRDLSASTPIIFITAYYADELNRLKGYQLGAVDFLISPVIPEVLLSKVAVFVELAKKNIALQCKTEEIEELYSNLQVQQMLELKGHNERLQVEIEERKLAENLAHDLATKDPLTGLLNRRSLIEALKNCVVNTTRRKELLAVMFLDMDRFKTINDTLGHDVGDSLLSEVARHISASVREIDLVARLGGDEFVVVVNAMSSISDAVKIADKILAATEQAMRIGAYSIKVSLSIGISMFPQDGATAEDLMKNADLAMYHTKKETQGGVQFYSEKLNARLLAHRRLEHELQLALKNNEFELYYQPKIQLGTNRITGLEGLVRWHHPTRGLLESQEFIETATESGIIVELGDWVIAAACAQLRRWRDAMHPILNVPIAVNIAVPQIRPELIQSIETALAEYNIPPSYLQLEITESLLIRDLNRTRAILDKIHETGVSIAIDDFGTGYSSLSLLKSLPIDVLKIDQSFVRNLATDANDSIIVAAIVNMGQALGLVIVAEGAETETQLKILQNLQCNEYQGYLFSKPLNATELENRLASMEAEPVPTGNLIADAPGSMTSFLN